MSPGGLTEQIAAMDTQVFIAYVKKGEFPLSAVAANRLMSNLIIGGAPSHLPGACLLKDVSTDLILLRTVEDADPRPHAAKAVEVAQALEGALAENLPGFDQAWEAFAAFELGVLKARAPPIEAPHYKESPAFVNRAVRYLAKFLVTNQPNIAKSWNLFSGALNEVDRLQKSHGPSPWSLLFEVHCRALERIHAYSLMLALDSSGTPVAADLARRTAEVVGDSLAFYSRETDFPEAFSSPPEVIACLERASVEWREAFLRIMEINPRAEPSQRRLALNDEDRAKLSEAVADLLKKPEE